MSTKAMTKTMTLDGFVSFMEDNIEQFRDTWTANEKREPEDWNQNNMGLSDWLEQFDLMMQE